MQPNEVVSARLEEPRELVSRSSKNAARHASRHAIANRGMCFVASFARKDDPASDSFRAIITRMNNRPTVIGALPEIAPSPRTTDTGG